MLTASASESDLSLKRGILKDKGERLQQLCAEFIGIHTAIEEIEALLTGRDFDYNKYVCEYCDGKESPLHNAIKNEDKGLVTLLIKHAIRETFNVRDALGCSPLQEAVTGKNCGIVAALLKARADVHVLNKRNYSPLLSALIDNNLEIASLLVQHGADRNDVDTIHFLYNYMRKTIKPSTVIAFHNCLTEANDLPVYRDMYTTDSGVYIDRYLHARYNMG